MSINILPNYIIEGYIIPYLTSEDLFYRIRPLNSFFFECTKNTIQINFPEEMIGNLKNLVAINKNEELTQAFNILTQQLFADKNLLFIYSLELNFSLLIQKILEQSTDQRTLDAIGLFYNVTKNDDKYNLLSQRRIEELKAISGTEESSNEMRLKIDGALNVEYIDDNFNEYGEIFQTLDEVFLMSMDLTGALFKYLGKLIEFQYTKFKHKKLREKLEFFFKQITETSNKWPKKKKFFEKTMMLIQSSIMIKNPVKKFIDLLNKYNIENPINDWLYHKVEIESNEEGEYFNILNNRKVLSIGIDRIGKMCEFYNKCLISDENESYCEVKKRKILIPDFLFIVSLIHSKFDITEDSFEITNNLIKKYKNSIKRINN